MLGHSTGDSSFNPDLKSLSSLKQFYIVHHASSRFSMLLCFALWHTQMSRCIQFSQFQIFWKWKRAKSFARISDTNLQTAKLNVVSKNLLVFFAPSSIFDFWLSDVLFSKYFLKNVKKQNEKRLREEEIALKIRYPRSNATGFLSERY